MADLAYIYKVRLVHNVYEEYLYCKPDIVPINRFLALANFVLLCYV